MVMMVIAAVLVVPGAAAAASSPRKAPASKSWERSVGDAAQQPGVRLDSLAAPSIGGVQAQDVGLWRYVVNVDPGGDPANVWATQRNTINGYVLANAKDGYTFDVLQRTSDFVYYFGFTYGSVYACGWIYAQNLDPKAGTPVDKGCNNPNIPLNSFASQVNSAPVGDGAPTTIQCANTEATANVSPWQTPFAKDFLRYYQPGQTVLWRYVTRYAPYYVMVRDPAMGANEGKGSWFFVPRSCLPASLPYAQGV
jgi:hypothetical protein